MTRLLSAISATAAESGERAAMACNGEVVTYRRLEAATETLAERLRAVTGSDRGFVAIDVPPGPDLVAAIVACAKCSNPYFVLDEKFPEDRRARYMAQLRPIAIVRGGIETGAAGMQSLPIEKLGSGAVGGASDVSTVPVASESIAYAVFTSGSTGRPKAVVVSWESVNAMLSGALASMHIGTDERWSLLHSGAFDFSVWEIWGALSTGSTLAVIDSATRSDPARLAHRLDIEGVTILSATPTVFWQLMDENVALPHIRHIVLGGEAVATTEAFAASAPRCGGLVGLVNMYGISECTVHSTAMYCDYLSVNDIPEGSVVGTPLAGTEVDLVKSDLRRASEGETGEIYVRGSGLALGYLGDPARTASRFVASPWGPAGTRMYRSGDVGRLVARRYLEHLGRADRELKILGHRVDPVEVETVLHAAARSFDVFVEKRDDVLASYCVGDGEIDVANMRKAAHSALPYYMRPARYFLLRDRPVNGNGKLDIARLRLEAVEISDHHGGAGRVDTLLRGHLEEVLGRTVTDSGLSFLDLGGDSLKAARLAARLESATGRQVTAKMIFDCVSIADLSEEIDRSPEVASVRPRLGRR